MSPTVRRAPHGRLATASVAALALVGGLALGRLVTSPGDGPAVPAPVTLAAATTGAQDEVAVLEAAVAARPEDAPAWRSLGAAYVTAAAETGDPAFYGLAERALAQAADLAPGDPTVLVVRGALALSLHRFEEAERLGQQATDALPANADALGVLVDAQVELGDYDGAARTLQAMLDARPGLPALARTSYLRELRGDLEGAEEAMRAAVAASSASPFETATVTTLLGDLQRSGGALDAALSSYDDALGRSPGFVPAELGRAQALAARGELRSALGIVEAVVDRQPAPAALALLAELQHVTGERGEAETAELYRLSGVLREDAGQVVDLEAAVFEADLGDDPARAVALARAAYAARPDNIFAADAVAWALLRAGSAEAAVPFAERAVRLGTADPAVQHHAAEVFAAVGDAPRAAAHLERAVRGGTGFTIRHRAAVEALAARLGVDPPALP